MRIGHFGLALAMTAGSLAVAQSPAIAQATDADKAFAQSLAAMTLDQAQTAIAHADPAQITAGAARALRELGNATMAKRPEAALLLDEKALAIAGRLNDPLLTASLLLSKGQYCHAAGDNETALAVYDQSIAIYETATIDPKNSPREIPLAYSSRAIVRMHLGDLDGALEDGRAALKVYRLAGDDVSVARTLNNLGNTELALGHYAEAREDYEEGLKLARVQHQRQGEAFLLTNISNTYLQQDNYPLATDYCLQSVKLKEELGNKTELVSSLVNLYRIYEHAGKDAEAQQTIQRAYSLAQESGRSASISLVLASWGDYLEGRKQYEQALEKLNKGLELNRKAADRLNENDMLEQIAEVELLMHRFDDASRDATTVMTSAVQMGTDLNIANSANTLGKAELGLGHLEAARTAFERSIATVERMRDNIAGGDQARSDFFSERTDVYRSLASLDAAQGRWEDAFLLSEREKGRALLDLLTQGKSTLSTALTTQEKTEEKNLHTRLAALEEQRTSAALDATPNAAHVAALDGQLAATHTAILRFRERIYAAHPGSSRHRGDAQLVTLAATAQLLPSASTAILEYEVTEAATYLFVITQGPDGPTLHGYTIPIASTALRTRVQRLQTALTTRDPGFAAPSLELYRLLLAPAKADLAGKRTLVVIPSGDLWHLPFQALEPSPGRYLIDDANLTYAPSLSVLNAYATHTPSPTAGHTLLALGDPGSDLPEAATEVRTLATLYGKPNARSFTGAAANKENFLANAATYDIVHLATDGVFDDRNPMYSHLLLASAETHQIAQLDAAEIADMKLNAALVVLSACQTAEGKVEDGEGLIGLSWSFLAAGSQSAVASQWRVESASTTSLMIAFHRGLQQHMSTAAALRHAELSLAHNPRYRHPFYWAGFVLLGG